MLYPLPVKTDPLPVFECDECGKTTLTPITTEVFEIEKVPVIRCFCSEDCKNEYLSA